jgi:hypothetical protein
VSGVWDIADQRVGAAAVILRRRRADPVPVARRPTSMIITEARSACHRLPVSSV